MSEKQKILVCGDVEGKFKTLFTRVESINKKSGPFDMLLCVGNFFGINNVEFEEYKKCLKHVCVPTYILGPNKEEHKELYPEGLSEFCLNVHYLGKRGVYHSSGGLKIAYLSGIPKNEAGTKSLYEFDKTDVVALRDACIKGQPNFRGVDILLTSPWPQNVTSLDTNPQAPENVTGSELISWLATEIKPRYHISGLQGVHYERSPYRNRGSQGEPRGEIATRFISMARVGNSKKEKWLYALNLTPVDRTKLTDLYQQTTDETPCPYTSEILLKALGKREEMQYFYDMNAGVEEKRKYGAQRGGPQKKRRQQLVFDQSKCWFCLASPDVEKHLVVSVGEEVYLALAKGGMVDEHLLILPIEHHQSLLNLPQSVVNEIQNFKEALQKYFDSCEKVPIFFERNYKTSHLQIQVVPVPRPALRELEEIFKDEADGHSFNLHELPSHNRLDQVVPSGAPYFCVELPEKTLYTRCSAGFPLQFGRQVLATGPVLNIPDRIEWQDCTLPRNEEDKLVQRIRKDFEPFDFTVGD